MRVARFVLCLIVVAAFALPAAAQEPAFLSKHGAWTAHVTQANGRVTCFAWSKPTKSQGKYTSRGDVLAFVTVFKPPPKGDDYYAGGQISLVAGYRYQKGAAVEATIGKQRFELFSDDDTAWASGSEGDKRLIDAMKKGASMTVRGSSWRPTKTVDTYSLKGFTAALNAIRAACK